MPDSDNKQARNGTGTDPSKAISSLEKQHEIERRVVTAEGLFQGDVTILTVLESLAEGVVVIDNSESIVMVNNQTERLFGYVREELLGQSLDALLPARTHVAHNKHVQGFFGAPKIRPMGLGLELFARHKDGHEFPVEISLSHIETPGNRLALAFVTDITLRKEAENDLRSRNEELDAFAHTVAHDLKGALTPMLGYCQILVDPEMTLKDQQVTDALNEVHGIGQKMADVIDELLLLSSVRKEDVPVGSIGMLEIIDSALSRIKLEYEDFNPEIIVAESLPRAIGYAAWVEAVWYNYISNAIRYGGSPPKIEIGGELRTEGFVTFWVKDNGKGLSNDELPHIFTPYAPRARSSNGHGLGLSIVKRIVEKLDGEVGVQSQCGEGSTFSFTLPVLE